MGNSNFTSTGWITANKVLQIILVLRLPSRKIDIQFLKVSWQLPSLKILTIFSRNIFLRKQFQELLGIISTSRHLESYISVALLIGFTVWCGAANREFQKLHFNRLRKENLYLYMVFTIVTQDFNLISSGGISHDSIRSF